jgi:hypothetical protein
MRGNRALGPRVIPLVVAAIFMTGALRGQESVCDLFRDLKAAEGRQLVVTGDLIISQGLTTLSASDCVLPAQPAPLGLRPSPSVPAKQLEQLRNAATEADRLRREGKTVSASASFSGRLRITDVAGLQAELTFDSIKSLQVEALPDPAESPSIAICELFQYLPASRVKRIVLRGDSVSTAGDSSIRTHYLLR